MDQPLFKNIIYNNKESKQDALKYMILDSPSSISFFLFSTCITIIMFCFAGILADAKLFFSAFFFMISYFAYFAIAYFSSLKKILSQYNEIAKGRDVIIENNIYDDKIEVVLYETCNSLYFSEVKSVVLLEKYIVVKTKSSLFITLQNDSFTIGTYGDFINFLKYKGIKVKSSGIKVN